MEVYLDNNATTPLSEIVKQAVIEALSIYQNPSSPYSKGAKVKSMISEARFHCASLINAHPDDIIFTSGGSESSNTVLNPNFIKQLETLNGRNELIVSAIEHPSIMNSVKNLQRNGFKVHYSPVNHKGRVILDLFESFLSEKTALVSIMMANNELGTIQEIQEIACLAHKKGALVHTDAVQAVGKIPVDVGDLNIDYLSYSGHKIYGPKGTGILYIKENSPFLPYIYGGNQEKGKRSGTENTIGIIGLGKAVEIAKKDLDNWQKKYLLLKNRLIKGLKDFIENISINGDLENCLPQTVNVSFPGTEAEVIQFYLDNYGIYISTGSACSSGSPSFVLKAIGLDNNTANATVRFSLGIQNTEEEIDYTIDVLKKIIPKLVDHHVKKRDTRTKIFE